MFSSVLFYLTVLLGVLIFIRLNRRYSLVERLLITVVIVLALLALFFIISTIMTIIVIIAVIVAVFSFFSSKKSNKTFIRRKA
ncbi:hypothetical protein HZB00_01365 [Candidatus Woesearchaeota archaeon]|nr:hypothetical protein [Candidatus Woesearchaeota archaeon]